MRPPPHLSIAHAKGVQCSLGLGRSTKDRNNHWCGLSLKRLPKEFLMHKRMSIV